MKRNRIAHGIESTFYTEMFNYRNNETRSEFEIFYDAAMRSVDGRIGLTDSEVEHINNNRESGSAIIDCTGMEVAIVQEAA